MSLSFKKRHRREPLELQLTAMIDIFTMIVIFLVMGTIIGVADLPLPEGMKLPKSYSLEGLDMAPQLVIGKKAGESADSEVMVQLKGLSGDSKELNAISIQEFKKANGTSPLIEDLRLKIKDRLATLTPEQKAGGVLLNVMADRSTPYADIYDVIKVFREAGYESLLFVADGNRLPADATSSASSGSGP